MTTDPTKKELIDALAFTIQCLMFGSNSDDLYKVLLESSAIRLMVDAYKQSHSKP